MGCDEDEVFQTTEQASTTGHQYSSTLSNVRFNDFMLRPQLHRCISDLGFERPSEVQAECIPLAMLGKDMICQAKPGTGKSAVFILATLHQIEPVDGVVSVVVLCHTRELAYQLRNDYHRLSRYMSNVRTGALFGGTSIVDDIAKLNNPRTCPHIIVATPGRLFDLLRRHYVVLNEAKFFILDECDMLLKDLAMRREVQEVFFAMPQRMQVMMFSATLPTEVQKVCRKFMREPVEIQVDDGKLISSKLQQRYLRVLEYEKTRVLTEIMDKLDFEQICIFVNAIPRAIELDNILRDCSFPSTSIHSDLDQCKRLQLYNAFRNFETRIMVATDIFGRGVDVRRVNLVINYDMPQSAETYVHRVNRAGRFGTEAIAISFITRNDDEKVLEEIRTRFGVEIKLYDHL
ncbi:DEAD-box ATP-dependent RNA helicase 56-like protein [Fennellomyces sp. T-0311]|nr:DEAD-box ATP-dependent RNA helicase 56-like protein [Fennellomyces sp. T-0311]